MFYKIPANFIDLSPTHREIIAFEFVAELMDHPVDIDELWANTATGCS